MKLSVIPFAVLVTFATAIPHGLQARPNRVRRDPQVVTTSMDVFESAVLYADQNGNPVTTSMTTVTAADAEATVNAAGNGSPWGQPAPFSSVVSETLSVPTVPAEASNSGGSSTDSQATTTSASPASTSPSYGGSEGPSGTGYSIAYAPYNADHSCKTEDQINQDMENLSEYGMVRIYGTDCDQVRLIMAAARRNNQKVFAGIWDPANAQAEAELLIDGAKDDWNRIHSVSVGNEVLSNGTSLSTLTGGIDTARSALKAGGYPGLITTVEVYSKLWEEGDSGLCDHIDYVAANCHAYFDATQTADDAGQFVREQIGVLQTRFCNKDVVITESGWPSEGMTNGKAVPGRTEQATAIQALQDEFSTDQEAMILFSAYNDAWKDDNKFGVEHYWGIHGNAPSA